MFGILQCTDDGVVDAGFIASWQIEDEYGEPLDCSVLNAGHVTIEITDSNEVSHVFRAPCSEMRLETDDWEIAVGKGTILVSIRTESDLVIVSAEPVDFNFVSGKIANQLPDFLFIIPDEILGDTGPKIDIEATLQDSSGRAVTCESVGAAFFSFTLTDSSGKMVELGNIPCSNSQNRFHTKLKTNPKAGAAELEIAFRSATFIRVYQTTTHVEIPYGDMELGPIPLIVTPRTLAGNAGIVWKWTMNGEPLNDKTCEDLGIDYAAVFVWDEALQFWWTDPTRLRFPCSAFDHEDDDSLFGEDEYSGFYIPNFAEPGNYRLFLGFYRKYSIDGIAMNTLGSDDLVAYDEAYPDNESGPSGTLLHNSELDLGINQLATELSEHVNHDLGVLEISLFFELNETGAVDSCLPAAVSQMGLLVTNEAGPATSSVLSETVECPGMVSYWDLPVVDKPYTLVTYGLNDQNAMSWYAICDGLVPEVATGLPMISHLCILSLIDAD
jgi:hypothetical protein